MNILDTIEGALPSPLRTVFRGVGQVFFCGSALTGAVFFIALLIAGLITGLAAIVGAIASTLTAKILALPEDEIDAGLFGFNGTLVGIALFLNFEASVGLWLLMIGAAAFSTVLQASLMRILDSWKVPVATAPFVFTSWIVLAAASALPNFPLAGLESSWEFTGRSAPLLSLPPADWLTGVMKGVSEVMLADSVLVGALFLVGIALTSVRGALLGAAGALIGVASASIMGGDADMISLGLWSFNPTLTVMAVGWVFLSHLRGSLLLAVGSGIVTVFIQAIVSHLLDPSGLPALTFPFVATTWIFILAAQRMKLEAA